VLHEKEHGLCLALAEDFPSIRCWFEPILIPTPGPPNLYHGGAPDDILIGDDVQNHDRHRNSTGIHSTIIKGELYKPPSLFGGGGEKGGGGRSPEKGPKSSPDCIRSLAQLARLARISLRPFSV